MKQLLFLFLISTYCLNCTTAKTSTPDKLSIGVLSALDASAFTKADYFKAYFSDAALKEPIQSTQKIMPYNNFIEYDIYQFICLEATASYYKILIDQQTIAYISTSAPFVFQDWTSYLVRKSILRKSKTTALIVNPISDKNLVPYNCPDDNLIVTNRLSYQGKDWLEVSFSPNCEEYPTSTTPLAYGWIEWRRGEELLVDIALLQ